MKDVIKIQGLDTQSITPNRIVVRSNSDGTTDLFYSNRGDQNHGHTVLNSTSDIVFARSRGGNIIKNS